MMSTSDAAWALSSSDLADHVIPPVDMPRGEGQMSSPAFSNTATGVARLRPTD